MRDPSPAKSSERSKGARARSAIGASSTGSQKKASKPFRDDFGHTPLSVEEDIPWDCLRLVVGTGAEGALPLMDEVRAEAGRRGVALVTIPTREAIGELQAEPESTNAILHVTC